jgi:hypothetical protein
VLVVPPMLVLPPVLVVPPMLVVPPVLVVPPMLVLPPVLVVPPMLVLPPVLVVPPAPNMPPVPDMPSAPAIPPVPGVLFDSLEAEPHASEAKPTATRAGHARRAALTPTRRVRWVQPRYGLCMRSGLRWVRLVEGTETPCVAPIDARGSCVLARAKIP